MTTVPTRVETPRAWASLRDVPAWVISFGMHMVLLIVLGMITTITAKDERALITSTIEDVESEYEFDLTSVADQVGNSSDVHTLTASQEAALAASMTPQEQMEKELEEEILNPEIPDPHEIEQVAKAELTAAVQTKGSSVHAGGVEGSIDRLAFEISGTLRENKTLVVWLFDVSPSLRERREAIAERFETVYKQLGVLNKGVDRELKTGVVAFGDSTTIVTPDPLDDVAELVKKVRNIKSQDGGQENVFAAVLAAANRWLSYRTKMRREIMMIIVTDEAGSDPQRLEQAIALTKRYGIRCYCVGDAAPFGRETTEIPFVLESGENVIGVMHRGPESFFPERLQLAFWGVNGRDLEEISSGFGPYALTRLCAETNGLYLIADEGPGYRSDHEVMRDYQPDYDPIPRLEAEIRNNAAKRALVEVAQQTKVDDIPRPQLRFRADSDTALRQAITEAQKPLAVLDHGIQRMLQVLELGEKDRPKVSEPRWRAGYDLAMGRVLAMRVRAYGYNVMLAEMKANPLKFEKPDSNMWRLAPSREITSGASVRKLAKRADEYLKRVVDEHQGTPWARLAERELSQPLGWEWHEGKMNIPNGGGRRNDNDPKVLFADDEKEKAAMRKKRPAPPKRREI